MPYFGDSFPLQALEFLYHSNQTSLLFILSLLLNLRALFFQTDLTNHITDIFIHIEIRDKDLH